MITKDLNGIVFNIFNYKENDLIVDVFCYEYGFIQLYVRGGQKTTSKSFFILKLFNIIKFDVSKISLEGLSSYKSGTVIKHFNYTSLTYDGMNATMLLSELLNKIKYVKDFDVKMFYKATIASIKAINLSKLNSTYFIVNYFILKSLEVLGSQLQLNKCDICESFTKIVAFSLDNYGFICSRCVSGHSNVIKDEVILKYLYYLNIGKEYSIDMTKERMIFSLLNNLLCENVGIYLLSANYFFKEEKR